MFAGVRGGWELFRSTFRVLGKHPVLIVPILACWAIYAAVVLWAEFKLDWDALPFGTVVLLVFAMIFVFAFVLAMGCLVLLELVQRIEQGRPANLFAAMFEAFTVNLVLAMPIIIAWCLVWFVLVFLEAVFSRKKAKKDRSGTSDGERATRALMGKGGWTWDVLHKAIRMLVFLAMPAIAWERKSPWAAMRRAFHVVRMRNQEFVTGFMLTLGAAAILFTPPGILLYLTSKLDLTVPGWAWAATIVYIAFAWSLSIYLEQMFTAELYLWHTKWERVAKGQLARREPITPFANIARPSVLDDVPDLADRVAFKHVVRPQIARRPKATTLPARR